MHQSHQAIAGEGRMPSHYGPWSTNLANKLQVLVVREDVKDRRPTKSLKAGVEEASRKEDDSNKLH
jgi:hypothetical protein